MTNNRITSFCHFHLRRQSGADAVVVRVVWVDWGWRCGWLGGLGGLGLVLWGQNYLIVGDLLVTYLFLLFIIGLKWLVNV